MEAELKDVGDQALMRVLDTAFPIICPGLFLSHYGRRSVPATKRLTDTSRFQSGLRASANDVLHHIAVQRQICDDPFQATSICSVCMKTPCSLHGISTRTREIGLVEETLMRIRGLKLVYGRTTLACWSNAAVQSATPSACHPKASRTTDGAIAISVPNLGQKAPVGLARYRERLLK
ncbi:hypothetical protein ABID08_006410 [Rhizobium binae]|uniref:Transposase n=1 Tax=Rhizobium binae TaxID=1138190 RepID=A0ABV2MRJ1_9HYPH